MVELSTQLLAEIGGWPALKEARVLVERGKVSDARREGAVLRGRVQGPEKIHDAQITLGERIASVEVKCTCIESRRSGRVCAHALAVGLALLQPATAPAATAPRSVAAVKGPRRWLVEDAPDGTPRVELTFLLPLNLRESLAKDPVRVILEARGEGENQPWDAIGRTLEKGFALSESDERALAALERCVGGVAGVNMVPRAKMGEFLHALDAHPRVWSGKKERLEIRASAERARLVLQTLPDGSLELSAPAAGKSITAKGPLPGWSLDGATLTETPTLPPGFVAGKKLIPHAAIPTFLARDWIELERACDVERPPGLEFKLETAPPAIEARIDGSLSGLTLELGARYGVRVFPLGWKADPDGENYLPDERDPHRFWRRDLSVEKQAAIEVQAVGFSPVRGGGLAFSLIQEKKRRALSRQHAAALAAGMDGHVRLASRIDAAADRHRGAAIFIARRLGRGLAESRSSTRGRRQASGARRR